MLATFHYEPSVQGYVISLGDKDSIGNELHESVELLVKADTRSAVDCHTVEALVALLRNVDDFALVKKEGGVMPAGWEVPDGAIGKEVGNEEVGNENGKN